MQIHLSDEAVAVPRVRYLKVQFEIPNLILQLAPPGLHPELIAFFDLKSQNKNCFSGLAPNSDLALSVSSGGLQTDIGRPGSASEDEFRLTLLS